MQAQERSEHRGSPSEPRVESRIDDARRRGVALTRVEQRRRSIERLDAKRRALHRDAHALVLEVTGDGVVGREHPDWWYDLRRGQLRIYGSLLRFLDAASRRTPKWMLLMIPAWIAEYIEELYDVADVAKGA